MGLAPMEGVLPGPRSEMAILLLFFDTGTLSTLLFRWPAGCSLDPLSFSIANLWLCHIFLVCTLHMSQTNLYV